MKTSHRTFLLCLVCSSWFQGCGEAEPSAVAVDALGTDVAADSTDPQEECVLWGGKKISRRLHQFVGCLYAAGLVAKGKEAVELCCPTDPNEAPSENCFSARYWSDAATNYYEPRCARRMSCGEINGLYLWFFTKEKTFSRLINECSPEETNDEQLDR